jgi:hypothetical protein
MTYFCLTFVFLHFCRIDCRRELFQKQQLLLQLTVLIFWLTTHQATHSPQSICNRSAQQPLTFTFQKLLWLLAPPASYQSLPCNQSPTCLNQLQLITFKLFSSVYCKCLASCTLSLQQPLSSSCQKPATSIPILICNQQPELHLINWRPLLSAYKRKCAPARKSHLTTATTFNAIHHS